MTTGRDAAKAQRAWQAETPIWSRVRDVARQSRAKPTPAEETLWEELRGRRLKDAKFRRQHAIGRFVVDFYCGESKLVIKVDGPIHVSQAQDDMERDVELNERGLTVIRFTNDEVMQRLGWVKTRIAIHLTPNPSPTSERGTQRA